VQVENSGLCSKTQPLNGARFERLGRLQSKLLNTKSFQSLKKMGETVGAKVQNQLQDILRQRDTICLNCDKACMTAYVLDVCLTGSGEHWLVYSDPLTAWLGIS